MKFYHDLTKHTLEELFELLNEELSEMDYAEVQEEIEYRLREEDDGDRWSDEQYENAEFEQADEWFGCYDCDEEY